MGKNHFVPYTIIRRLTQQGKLSFAKTGLASGLKIGDKPSPAMALKKSAKDFTKKLLGSSVQRKEPQRPPGQVP